MKAHSIVLTDNQMIAALEQRQAFALRGMQNLETFRRVLHTFVRTTGIHFVLDPETDPHLRDYLASGGLGVLEGAAAGGLLGLAVGVLAEEPALAGIGVLLGAVVGGVVGMNRVQSGWRVRATWALDGRPELLVQPI
ncbi:hypothetical protein [Sorangium cellulosum]|uniref:Glycine zipper domain-containing protein n=1 Tax=Sorangium cellulosum So0157-2 TaxID=1254432 RepID=S4Y7V0_SORCE|nr:hypothetical protein [Sorangium cellulosum]AGP41517.1 hypothetical protein SCE1572_47745 [Sorangium cellulosum So0157-2]